MSHHLLSSFPVTTTIPLQWGEMDAYGHLNNVVYFRYFESARIRYLEACGFTRSYEEERIGAILHSTEARFRRALRYPDTVAVGTRVSDLSTDRFTMEYRVVSSEEDAVAADGRGIVVSFDYQEGRKVEIPDAIRRRIEEIEAGAAEGSRGSDAG